MHVYAIPLVHFAPLLSKNAHFNSDQFFFLLNVWVLLSKCCKHGFETVTEYNVS